jgi:hypothetical protein
VGSFIIYTYNIYNNECRELDPHGATGAGNPVGGNVTSNITGSDQAFAEWMVFKISSFHIPYG